MSTKHASPFKHGEKRPALRFTEADVQCAYETWGCNCGPTAIAAMLGMSLDQLRPHLGDFERKHYTNPTLMQQILGSLGVDYGWLRVKPWTELPIADWNGYALMRIQWAGPWLAPGKPPQAAYRHTHWVGYSSDTSGVRVFDCNAVCIGGWLTYERWATKLVPWLLQECQPRADGRFYPTHVAALHKWPAAQPTTNQVAPSDGTGEGRGV